MTNPVKQEDITKWLDTHHDQGQPDFTVTNLQVAASELFPEHPVKRRMMYHICQQYIQIMGITPTRRMRRNMNELVFTLEQAGQILEGMRLWSDGGQSYAEAFLVLKGGEPRKLAKVVPQTQGQSDLNVETLLHELRGLRSEVGALREAQAELTAEVLAVRREALKREDLWRLLVGTLAVSVDAGVGERVMGYLGVTELAGEVAALEAAGLEREMLGL